MGIKKGNEGSKRLKGWRKYKQGGIKNLKEREEGRRKEIPEIKIDITSTKSSPILKLDSNF